MSIPEAADAHSGSHRGASAAQRAARIAGTLLILIGLVALAWAVVVWRWGDPVTALYTRVQQHRLASAYEERVARSADAYAIRVPASTPKVRERPSLATVEQQVARVAGAYRRAARPGDAAGRLTVPRMGLNAVLVEGTDTESLRRGPGRDERTWMPGEGKLVYVAGHRTTYGAPFADIDRLVTGDRVTVSVPYGTFTYTVTSHVIVPSDDLRVLRTRGRDEIALQACHPRFRATHRYIVYARLSRIQVRVGDDARSTTYAVPVGRPLSARRTLTAG